MSIYAWVNIACMPLRTEPSESSEMATQLLFGDVLYVLERWGNWARVHNLFDDYVGWVDAKTLCYFNDLSHINVSESHVVDTLFSWAIDTEGRKILLPAGATLTNFSESDLSFGFNEKRFTLLQPLKKVLPTPENILSLAGLFFYSPYLWGGKTAFGIDCSGLVQVVFKIVGIHLLRDAAQQVHHGTVVNFIEEAKPADLLFFDNDWGHITHVGIYMGNGKIIHASGKVRIDDVDNYGIYRAEIQQYSHKLRIIKRILHE